MKQIVVFSILCLSMSFISCSPSFIKGTKLKDTSKNREIIRFVKQYEVILKEGRWTQLSELISPAFRGIWKSGKNKGKKYSKLQLIAKFVQLEKQKIQFSNLKIHVVHLIDMEPTKVRVFLKAMSGHSYPRGDYTKGYDAGVTRFAMTLQKSKYQWRIIAGGI